MTRIAALASVLFLSAATALPCSLAIETHELDPGEKAVDRVAPTAPVVELEKVTRGKGAEAAGGGMVTATSCDDIGMITFRFATRATDDRTPFEKIGYRFVLAGGVLPEGMTLPQAQRTPMLHWIDGATDDQEPVDFAVSLVAIDLAGNESAPSAPVRVRSRNRVAKE